MFSQCSSHLKSQRGPLTQKIPPSNWSAAGILGPDLVCFNPHCFIWKLLCLLCCLIIGTYLVTLSLSWVHDSEHWELSYSINPVFRHFAGRILQVLWSIDAPYYPVYVSWFATNLPIVSYHCKVLMSIAMSERTRPCPLLFHKICLAALINSPLLSLIERYECTG